MKRIWKCKMNCQMPWRDFVRNETVELEDEQVTPRVKALFDCLTTDEVKAEEEAKKEDPDLKVMVQRLKAAKIPIKRGASKEDIKRLFDEFLAAQPTEVADSIK